MNNYIMHQFKATEQFLSEITPIKKFKLNTKGRDFVIGDVHGEYSYLMALLDHVNFDKNKDRLFSTGDLIDRGYENEECLRLLAEPWFHATLGNHEAMVLMFFYGQMDPGLWIANGARWAAHYISSYQNKKFDSKYRFSQDAAEFWYELVPLIMEKMSKMITVRLRSWKKFHVVHAELNSHNFKLTDKNLLNAKFVNAAWTYNSDYGGIGDECDGMWRRSIFNGANPDLVRASVSEDYLSTIYSGHTIQSNTPFRVGPFVCLDTGSFMGNKQKYGISMTMPETGETWMSNGFGVSAIEISDTESRKKQWLP